MTYIITEKKVRELLQRFRHCYKESSDEELELLLSEPFEGEKFRIQTCSLDVSIGRQKFGAVLRWTISGKHIPPSLRE